ncbi:uncharacterized protein LOC124406532 [Diprion similis]|uniref:uncharacterized protein LOC124406532 n=1 Tax=Diprion similis TaxID=362088 RepID=UPI001EF9864B|nr:uncharacterized protein LOC124406532 [Diprion similis]
MSFPVTLGPILSLPSSPGMEKGVRIDTRKTMIALSSTNKLAPIKTLGHQLTNHYKPHPKPTTQQNNDDPYRVERMDLVAISACAVLCAVFYAVFDAVAKLVNKLAIRDDASKFEGPPRLPLIGSAHLFMGGGEAILNRCREFNKLYSKPYRVVLGNHILFVTSNPEQIKVILHSPTTLEKGDVMVDFTRPLLGSGLLISPASIWRVRRKLIQPTFSFTILKSFLKIFAAKAVILVKRIEDHVDGPEFEVQKYFLLCTLDTICVTAMGVDLEAQTKGDCRYADAARSVIASTCTRIFSPWLHPDFIFNRSKLGKTQRQSIEFLHDFANNVITEKRKTRLHERTSRTGLVNDEYDDCDTTARREAFLDHLMKLSDSNGKLTDQAIREEVDTFIIAGSDTTAIAMSFLMLMLASHQNIQEKVYEELCEIYGDEDGGELSITAENLSRMVYLERVIKETLRLFPVAPFIVRKVTEDLNLGERTLPKGSTVALNILETHRSEENWLDPLKFDPDRFLPENFAKQHPYSFIPFSGGSRNCIGHKYAMLLMKTLTATILRRYVLTKDNVEPIVNIRIKMEFELQPVVPITVGIKRRIRRTTFTQNVAYAVVCAIFYCVAELVNKFRSLDDTSKFEGPMSLPIIGSGHLFIGDGEAILKKLQEFGRLYSKPYRLVMGSYAYFVTSNPDQIKVLVHSSKSIEKADKFVDFFRPWLGSGLLTGPASKWRVHRKLIQPTFSSKILKSFLEVFATKAVILVKQIENHVDGPEFKVQKYFLLCTLDTICGTAMGVDFEAQAKGDCRYAEAVRSVMGAICARGFQPWLHPDFIFYRTKLGKHQQENIKVLHDIAKNVIQVKKKEILERPSMPGSVDDEYDNYSTGDTTAHREIFLDRLVKLSRSNETLTDQAIREEVDTFILGGSNTTPIAMSFLMLMLASHQNIQDKVYEELYEIYGDEDGGELSITAENLSRMVYLERVIKETLRLFPVFPIILRKVTEDLNLGERTLPKGSAAIIDIMGAHRSEENWLDPLKFDPDRFSPEKFAEQHPYSFIPFSGGPRNCIGFKYAMLFMKTLAATLLRKYTFTKNKIVPVENVRIKLESELQPAEPITVGIKRRIQKTDLISDTSISP